MSKEEIVKIVNDFLIDEFELSEDKLTPNANLREDLEIESLDFVDIVVVIEKEFGFKVKGEEMVNVRVLGDLYDYIYSKVSNQ
jgi:acyl carrier protein